MAAPTNSALLVAALLLSSTAMAGVLPIAARVPCTSTSQLLQVRCDQVDSGLLGPLCAEPIGYTYDAFHGAVCLVVVPAVDAQEGRRVDHQGAPSGGRPQFEIPANRARAPVLPHPVLEVEQLKADRLDMPADRIPAPPLAPG